MKINRSTDREVATFDHFEDAALFRDVLSKFIVKSFGDQARIYLRAGPFVHLYMDKENKMISLAVDSFIVGWSEGILSCMRNFVECFDGGEIK
jgi:hypothetical protein